jgi:hypothetical protein
MAALYLLPTYGSTVQMTVTKLWQHCTYRRLLPTYGSTVQMFVTNLWQHCADVCDQPMATLTERLLLSFDALYGRDVPKVCSHSRDIKKIQNSALPCDFLTLNIKG